MCKLLIVDDNNMHIQCVLDYINWQEFGFTDILTAHNGAEAFEKYEKFKPNLIITDVVMPKVNGLELVNKIRNIDNNVHIIFMSCYQEFDYIKHAIDNDVVGYILKPIEPSLLQDVVKKVVNSIKEQTPNIASDNLIYHARANLLDRLLYSDDFETTEKLLTEAGYDSVKSAVIIKYLILNSIDHNKLYEVLDSINNYFNMFVSNAITEFPNKIIILLTSEDDFTDKFINDVITFIHLHLNYINECFDLSIAVGISNIHSSLADAKQMLYQANTALECTYSPQKNELYFFENFETQAENVNFIYNIQELKEDISTLLLTTNKEAVNDFLKKYYSDTITANKHNARYLCFCIIILLQLLFSEQKFSIDDLFDTPNVIWSKLNRFETIQDSYHWIKNILTAAHEFITTATLSDSPSSIVNEIKMYIDKHYSNITSLEQIASNIYVSAGYARNIFKKITGQTIFDYLVDRRISEAKKLLRNPTLKIYEIMSLVGYSNKAHFTETFKRKTGMTPKEYRSKIQGENHA